VIDSWFPPKIFAKLHNFSPLYAPAIAEQPYATCAVAGSVGLLLLPSTRSLLWRASFGRMQSEEVGQDRGGYFD
jgi:hypothetical protein